jgi:nucleoside-diphosphate-sugar epimerase
VGASATSKQTILITGATSSLGRPLLARILAEGVWTVRVLAHRNAAGLEGCEVVRADLRDPLTLKDAAKGVDTVLHLAACTHSHNDADYVEVNVRGTRGLLDVCERDNVKRFIHVSSRAAHPEGGAYAVSKLESEAEVRHTGMNWLILRPAEIYGGKSNDAINRLVDWVKKLPILPIIGDGRYTLRPIHIDDVIAELVAVVARPDLSRRVLLMSGPEELTLHQAIDCIAKVVGRNPPRVHVPIGVIRFAIAGIRLGTTRFLTADQVPRLLCAKENGTDVSALLDGIRPMTLESGLKRLWGEGSGRV